MGTEDEELRAIAISKKEVRQREAH